MLRKGMFLADRYEIIEQIGNGGMSNVYKAKCHKLNRFVAIKVLKQEYQQDRNFVSKFKAEAQAAAGLTHPNIVNVYDVGDENGVYYIVMELIEGITLKKYIEKRGKLPYREAVSIAIQVANGMEAAHKHNIVHRDIKPQNVIISKDGKVKVTDFGIAKAASSSTITASALGSVHYISPEQARGGYSDNRSDIYSLGITLFEMLTGKVPFDGDTTVAVAVQHIQDPIPLPSEIVEDIPVSVDQIVNKCTQKKAEMRYQNAADLIVDLKRSLVMPDENFVSIAPVYGSLDKSANIKNEGTNSNYAPEGAKNSQLKENNSDDILEDDELLDDDDDDDDILFEDSDNKSNKKKNIPNGTLKGNNETDLDDTMEELDIDDESNDKLEGVFKWIGVGIIALIVIILIFVTFIFFNKKGDNTEEQTTEPTQSETVESDDADKVAVPDVTGKSEDEALKLLNDLNLGGKSTRQSSDTVKEGLVIRQGTKAGTKVKKNTTVTLVISSGPATTSVPKITGLTENDAIATLREQGFSYSNDYAYSDTVAAGKVISQSPSAGASAAKGDTVSFIVSNGPEQKDLVMPQISYGSEKLSSATAKLSNAGIEYEMATGSSTDDNAIVIDITNSSNGASIKGGSKISEGTKVIIKTKVVEQSVELDFTEGPDSLSSAISDLKAQGVTNIKVKQKGETTYISEDKWSEYGTKKVVGQSVKDLAAMKKEGVELTIE